MPDSDGAALLRAILMHPAQDAPRLMYADWLDESGTDAARAEFIRLQVELARIPPVQLSTACPGCEYDPADGYHHNRPDCPVLRSDELLAAHGRKWAQVPCPNCKGTGCGGYVGLFACPHCDANDVFMCEHGAAAGTGDAMRRAGARYEFRRGFVERVTVPELSWVCERVGDSESGDTMAWRVTPWAIAITRTLPVTEFGIGDREPQPWNATEGPFTWASNTSPTFPHELPPVLWGELEGATLDNTFDGIKVYDSREAALLALAQAAGRLVRRAAGYAG